MDVRSSQDLEPTVESVQFLLVQSVYEFRPICKMTLTH